MAEDLTYTVVLKEAGDKTFVMPAGFDANVEIHCWGAGGGGTIGASGGGGGYASTDTQIPAGAVVRLQIGQPGTNGDRRTGGIGGTHPSYTRYRGGSAGSAYDEDWDTGAGGGGGGASAVVIDNSPVCVGAGGGGAGGLGDDSAGGTPGNPGGVYPGVATDIYPVTLSYAWCQFMNDYAVWGPFSPFTTTINFPTTGVYTFAFAVDNFGNVQVDGVQVVSSSSFTSVTYGNVTVNSGNRTVRVFATNTGGPAGVAVRILNPDLTELTNSRNYTVTGGLTATSDGGVSVNAWTSGGGGGGGYYGGQAGTSYGDDAGNAPGGNGGQNYGNITVAGSGILPGGLTSIYYPTTPPNIGRAGSPGYIVIILRKKLNVSIKNAKGDGTWTNVASAYVKTPSQSVTVSQAIGPQTTTYNSVGTNTFTVPAGVTSIQLTVISGGGGGGGADSSPGSAGRAGARASGTLAVSPGQILTISVGSGGGGGTSDQGSAPGGVGGTNNLGYSGGSGSAAGPTPISGGGGGGGAASAVLVNGSPIIVAAGGGGGGGGGNGVPGQGVSPGGTSGGIAGSAGQTKSGDGGGAGGGGGGYPQGGRGGDVGGGDVGGFSGADGQSLVPAGFSLGEGGTGGIPAIRGSRASSGGGGGSITISYTPAPVNVTVVTGGWKEVQQIYTKVNGDWKSISQKNDIILYNYK